MLRQTDYDGEGNVLQTITNIIGHQRISQITVKDGTEQELYFTFDGHGSTRVLTDLAGAMVQLYAYDAYGNAIGFDPAAALTEFLYSGEQFDAKIGQQYLRQRYYDPSTGRFNRLDPFFGNYSDPQSFHKYAYVHGDPVNNWDPMGEMSLGGAMMGGAIAGGLLGMSGGAIYGAQKSMKMHGTIWSFETLKYAALGGVGGAAIGAVAGAAIYLGPQFGNFLMTGRGYYLRKILDRHTKSEICGGIGFLMGFYQGIFEKSDLFSAIAIPTTAAASYGLEYIVAGTISNLKWLMLSTPRTTVNAIKLALINKVQPYTFMGTYFASGYCAGYFCGAAMHIALDVNTPGPLGTYFNNILSDIGSFWSSFNEVDTEEVMSIVEVFNAE